MYVYLKLTNVDAWAVGFYTPTGEWEQESCHKSQMAALRRVNYLNGGAKRLTKAPRRRGSKPGRPKGPTPHVKERNEKMRADRAAGMHPKDIAAKYGVSVNHAYITVRGAGAPLPRGPIPNSRPDIDARNEGIVQDYRNGMNSCELSDKHGISRERVCQILRRTNEIATAAERRQIAHAALAAERVKIFNETARAWREKVQKAEEAVRSGRSISDIGSELGLSAYERNKIGKALRLRGVQIRTGRHFRDYGPKIARVRSLRKNGLTWERINQILVKEGYGVVYGSWLSIHTPDLIERRHRAR